MMKRLIFFSIMLLYLSACSLAPTYKAPTMDVADHYQETGHWTPASTSQSPNSNTWWNAFHDPELNQLETQAQTANQNLLAAVARLNQARDLARAQDANLYPQLNLDATHQNARISSHKPLFPSTINHYYQDNIVGLDLNYEVDLWGALRNASTASLALAQASANDLSALRLSTQAELASDYFNLRATDAQLNLLQQLVTNWHDNQSLTKIMLAEGLATQADFDIAQLNLQNTLSQQAALQSQRAQLLHAIAFITGSNPDSFTLADSHQFNSQPLHPEIGLPSTLLERRPDIASAERAVMAANAQIGVARAAFFPVFSLNAGAGYENTSTAGWLNAPNRFWSVGPSFALNLFNGGQLQAFSDYARAHWEESVAHYRSTVLNAWREVENGLSNQYTLNQESLSSTQAAQAAYAAQQQAQYSFANGLGNQLQVLQSQRTSLSTSTTQIDIQRQAVLNSIGLVKALGGDLTSAAP